MPPASQRLTLCLSLSPVPGLVRAQAEGLAQFESLGGLEVLGGALQSPQAPLRARAAFLLHSLLREHPHLKGECPAPRPPSGPLADTLLSLGPPPRRSTQRSPRIPHS